MTSLFDLVLSPDFDADHFASEAIRNPHLSDTSLILAQLDSCHDRLKLALRGNALKLHACVSEREKVWQKSEGEILLLKETVATLRAAAKKKFAKIQPFRKIQLQAKTLENCYAALALVRRALKFSAELKKFRVMFPDISKVEIPAEAAARMAKSLEQVIQDSSDLEILTILQPEIAGLVNMKKLLITRFTAEIKQSVKFGKFNSVVGAARVLEPFGALDGIVADFIDEAVADVMQVFTSAGRGFMGSSGDKITAGLSAAAQPFLIRAAEAAVLQGATGRKVCVFFWEKFLMGVGAEMAKTKKSVDAKKTFENLKELGALAQSHFSRISKMLEISTPIAFPEDTINSYIK